MPEKFALVSNFNLVNLGVRVSAPFLWEFLLVCDHSTNMRFVVSVIHCLPEIFADFRSFVTHLLISLSDLILTTYFTTCFQSQWWKTWIFHCSLQELCDSNQSSWWFTFYLFFLTDFTLFLYGSMIFSKCSKRFLNHLHILFLLYFE